MKHKAVNVLHSLQTTSEDDISLEDELQLLAVNATNEHSSALITSAWGDDISLLDVHKEKQSTLPWH